MSNEDALEIVKLRNNFYRDSYRRVLAALLLMIVINGVLCAILGYVVTHRPKPEYFATTAEGRLMRLYPLSRPVLTPAELLQWATLAVTQVNTYNFVNWRKELQTASENFTPNGWKEYQDSLKKSRNLDTVIAKKLTVNAVATGAPVILDQGVVNGEYKWKVQLPILKTYESTSSRITQPELITVLITRVSTLETPKGIAIDALYSAEKPLQ